MDQVRPSPRRLLAALLIALLLAAVALAVSPLARGSLGPTAADGHGWHKQGGVVVAADGHGWHKDGR